MANATRRRAKEHFPAVLLTLLSIVQAIALELLWGHVVDSPFLYQATMSALLGWVQIVATLLAVVLVWVGYASNVMRFRWVPAVSDSVYPFLVGITEFWLVESLDANSVGAWFVGMGLLFALMIWIVQITMRRARFDPDNADFFAGVTPARARDFLPQAAVVVVFVAFGCVVSLSELQVGAVLAAAALTFVFLVWQFAQSVRYWNTAMAVDAVEPAPTENA